MTAVEPRDGSPHTGATSMRISLEVPITFDVPGGSVHSPMIEAIVGGIRTKLILDTGSTAHVLTRDLVMRSGLESHPAEPGTDHTGAPVASWSVGAVPIDVMGSGLDLQDVQAVEGPPVFEGWGIGGFLSPQGLDQVAWLLIDLAGNRLLLVECDEESLTSWLTKRYPALRPLRIRRQPGSAIRILAAIDPFPMTVAMINTGTPETEFTRAALPGLRGAPAQETGSGVSGTEVSGVVVAEQVLRVGDWACPLDRLFLRDERALEHPEGQIGMDALRGSVLAVSANEDRPIIWMVGIADEVGRVP